MSLTFSARVGEEGKLFGSVTASDIAEQLAAQGFTIEKRQIDLHEPIKALGVYRVPIRLHADVKPEIKVWVAPTGGKAGDGGRDPTAANTGSAGTNI